MSDTPIMSVEEPPELAAKMNLQTLLILASVLLITGVFVSYVASTLGKPKGAKTLAPAIAAPAAPADAAAVPAGG